MASPQLERLADVSGEVYLTIEELAERSRVTPWAVRRWRTKGQGPKATKLGGRVLFAMTDVIAWERSRREASG